MRSLFVLLLLVAALAATSPGRAAEASLSGATVTLPGGTAPDGAVPVAAAPGVSFGLTVTPQGSPPGAPVVLEVQLARPGDSLETPLLRWLVAAVVGQPAEASWEFAYDWEVIPGDWFMSVSCEGAELAKATFRVAAAPEGASPLQAAAQADAGANRTPDKKADRQNGKAAQAKEAPGRKDAETKTGSAPAKQPENAKATAANPREETKAKPAANQPQARQEQPAPPRAEDKPSAPPRQESKVRVGGSPGSTVQVLVGGTYSEEARALWVAVFLRKNGVKACVREQDKAGRKLWAVVTGWTPDPDEAKRMRQSQTQVVGDILIIEMTVADLERGLNCP